MMTNDRYSYLICFRFERGDVWKGVEISRENKVKGRTDVTFEK